MSKLTRLHRWLALAAGMVLVLLAPWFAQAMPTPPASPSPSAAPHRLYLPFLATSASAPSSEQLIDQALARGEIDAETALIYKVYVAFNDARLPQPYRGDDSEMGESMITSEVSQRFASLSLPVQALLAPFLLPPSAPGSWLELREAGFQGQASAATPAAIVWGKVPAVGGKAVVWYELRYPGDNAVAVEVAQQLSTKVWPDLTRLMGREPLSDASLMNNGGDGRLDVYLIHFPPPEDPTKGTKLGQAPGYDPRQSGGGSAGCEETPAYLLLDSRLTGVELHSVLAHEFMHAIQWSYPVRFGCVFPGQYAWFVEASGKWAEHYVYPGNQTEHRRAEYFLDVPDLPLNDLTYPGHFYGAYLWPFYLTNGESAPDLPGSVRAIWEKFRSYGSLEAIDKSIPGGFEKRWPEFALYNWNREPWDFYRQWDEMQHAVDASGDQLVNVVLQGVDGKFPLDLSAGIQPLSAEYFHLTFTDDNARTVAFYNGFTYEVSEVDLNQRLGHENPRYGTQLVAAQPGNLAVVGANVQALVKVAGKDWQWQDWTNQPIITFCRDKAEERLEELVLIFSNSRYDDVQPIQPAGLSPTLWASDIPCWQLQGEAHYNFPHGRGMTFDDEAEVVWQAKPMFYKGQNGVFFLGDVSFRSSGSIRYRISGKDTDGGTCIYTTDESAPITDGLLRINAFTTSGPWYRYYDGYGFRSAGVIPLYSCGPGDEPYLSVPWHGFRESIVFPEDDSLKVKPGGILDDSQVWHLGGGRGGDEVSDWRFEPVEP